MGFFNVDDYEMVQDRIVRFQKEYPKGAIINEVLETSSDGKRVLVKCSVYKNVTDPIPAGVDIAMDWQGKDTGATRTNWVETSATSATGRALSLVIGFKGKGRSSREEMMLANERINEPKKTTPKPTPKPKSIKEEVDDTKPKGSMGDEDAKKQELWEHIKETKVEYEKQMISTNPDIDPNDKRMKFPPSVYNNMEKCLGTLGWKKYESKWDQWLSIHNHFNTKKLEVLPDIPEDVGGTDIPVEDLITTLGVEGTITSDDLPPVDMDEHFSDFPEIDRDIEFKYKVKPVSEKQLGFIRSLASKNKFEESRLKSWVLHQFKKTLGNIDSKEASMIISAFSKLGN